MGRPSKLTPAQWSEVERRLLGGETARALGRELGISEASIRGKLGANRALSAQSAQVQETAQKIAEANLALEALPVAQRPVAMDLAEKLRSISQSVASAAELGARTGHRLHALANSEVGKVDDADPLSEESIAALKGVGVLTKLANESLAPALNLLSANKDRIKDGQMDEDALPSADMTDGQLARIAAASSR